MQTAEVAAPIGGDSLYQQRARAALPILVRQAEAEAPIFYSDLAPELEMSNPRNLNFVLGSIGKTIERLREAWSDPTIPPIQCLVINKNTGLPGEGIAWFLDKSDPSQLSHFKNLSRRQKRHLVEAELQRIFAYPKWRDVLQYLSLRPTVPAYGDLVSNAAKFCGGGESEQHRSLKEYVSRNPGVVDLPLGTPAGVIEHGLPSGDALDVSFEGQRTWIGVEVKSALSETADIVRGLFQCVKYRAVMEAVQVAQGKTRDARAILVLEGSLPARLVALKNMLGIEVIEEVRPR